MNIHGWSPFRLTGLISLLSKGLSRLIFSTTIQKHQFFYAQTSLWINSQIPFLITSLTDYWKNHSLSIGSFVGNVILLLFNKPCSSIVTFFPRSSPLAAVPFSSDYSIKLQFPPPAATHTSYILVWDTCFEKKTRPPNERECIKSVNRHEISGQRGKHNVNSGWKCLVMVHRNDSLWWTTLDSWSPKKKI